MWGVCLIFCIFWCMVEETWFLRVLSVPPRIQGATKAAPAPACLLKLHTPIFRSAACILHFSSEQSVVLLWSNKFPPLCSAHAKPKPILRLCAVYWSWGALQNKPAPFDWIRRQKNFADSLPLKRIPHLCVWIDTIKTASFFFFFPFCVKLFASLAQSGDLSKVVVFSVGTIYLNSIITDNLLANFKAECA